MNELGTSLLVGGMALLCSGLIFLLPVPSKKPVNRATIEEDQARAEYYLQQLQARQERSARPRLGKTVSDTLETGPRPGNDDHTAAKTQ
jgi:hypothetical protein